MNYLAGNVGKAQSDRVRSKDGGNTHMTCVVVDKCLEERCTIFEFGVRPCGKRL